MEDWKPGETQLSLLFLEDSSKQRYEQLNKQFFSQKKIENFADFGDSHYQKFNLTSMLMPKVNNCTKNEYRNGFSDSSFFPLLEQRSRENVDTFAR